MMELLKTVVIGVYIRVLCVVLKYIAQIACLHFAHRELEIFLGFWFFTQKITNVNHILVYIQQDAMLHSFFISGNCSTCFGWYLHPSSGAQQLYLQHLALDKPLLQPAAIVEEL